MVSFETDYYKLRWAIPRLCYHDNHCTYAEALGTTNNAGQAFRNLLCGVSISAAKIRNVS